MLYSHVAIQKSAQMISVCGAAFCNRLNCQLLQAFNKLKSIFSISKIYVCFKKLHFHIIYQEWDAVFHQQMKQWEKSWKYDAQQSIFDKLRGVSSGDETLCQNAWSYFSKKKKTILEGEIKDAKMISKH